MVKKRNLTARELQIIFSLLWWDNSFCTPINRGKIFCIFRAVKFLFLCTVYWSEPTINNSQVTIQDNGGIRLYRYQYDRNYAFWPLDVLLRSGPEEQIYRFSPPGSDFHLGTLFGIHPDQADQAFPKVTLSCGQVLANHFYRYIFLGPERGQGGKRHQPLYAIKHTYHSSSSYPRVNMDCALVIVFQARSLYAPTKNRSPSRGHFWESL